MNTFSARLVGGESENEGRVEIYRYRYGWGTICDDDWDDSDAQVVCGVLGFDWGIAYGGAVFGEGVGRIFMDDVRCEGNETSLWDCRRSVWDRSDCGHYEDAGVMCDTYLLSHWGLSNIADNWWTSSNGNIFRVTGPLWGESTGHRWIPLTKVSDTELWCVIWSAPEQTVEQTIKTPVIWDAIALIVTSLKWICLGLKGYICF